MPAVPTVGYLVRVAAMRVCRFYFLGDDDLLEILGQPSNPDIIQAHLKKLFAGIHSVTLNGSTIEGINSVEGESVPLSLPVQVCPLRKLAMGLAVDPELLNLRL